MTYRSETFAVPVRAPRRRGPVLLLSPSVLFLILAFGLPMGLMLGTSFVDLSTGSLTLRHYERFLTDGLSLYGLGRTAGMSAMVAVCVTCLGYPLAYYLARSSGRVRAIVFALALAPELAGVVLRTYGWLIILEDHGVINRSLMTLGLIAQPLPLSKNLFAVVVGLTHVILPFGVLALMASIQSIDVNLQRAAQMLGASPISILRHVLLPLSVPGIVSSLLLSFTMAASAYATPALLGGAGFKVLATMVADQVLFYLDWPFAAVMATVLLVMMSMISFLGLRFEQSRRLDQHVRLERAS